MSPRRWCPLWPQFRETRPHRHCPAIATASDDPRPRTAAEARPSCALPSTVSEPPTRLVLDVAARRGTSHDEAHRLSPSRAEPLSLFPFPAADVGQELEHCAVGLDGGALQVRVVKPKPRWYSLSPSGRSARQDRPQVAQAAVLAHRAARLAYGAVSAESQRRHPARRLPGSDRRRPRED